MQDARSTPTDAANSWPSPGLKDVESKPSAITRSAVNVRSHVAVMYFTTPTSTVASIMKPWCDSGPMAFVTVASGVVAK